LQSLPELKRALPSILGATLEQAKDGSFSRRRNRSNDLELNLRLLEGRRYPTELRAHAIT